MQPLFLEIDTNGLWISVRFALTMLGILGVILLLAVLTPRLARRIDRMRRKGGVPPPSGTDGTDFLQIDENEKDDSARTMIAGESIEERTSLDGGQSEKNGGSDHTDAG